MQAALFDQSPSALVAGIAFTALLAYACASDIRSRRIPNRLVALLAASGLIYSTATGASPAGGLVVGVAGLVLGFALWVPFYTLHWLGAGDVKLFAAAGAWLGPLRTAEGALVAAIAGGVLAAAWMLRAYGLQGTATAASAAIAAPWRPVDQSRDVQQSLDVHHRRALPYGVALGFGAAVAAWLPVAQRVFHAR